MSDRAVYLLVCRVCSPEDDPLILPFDSPAARGKWAAEHADATGHKSWWVYDEHPEETKP